mmetsp:Transcript_82492/g.163805  ORF Transcript_82492/g.163805 Transcript_82492/m.163805 type:complete len:1198 (+) Transcript_82492:211-3804(+)
MTNVIGGALVAALQSVTGPPWPRSVGGSLQDGCAGGAHPSGFVADQEQKTQLQFSTDQVGRLLSAISDRLSPAVNGRHIKKTDVGSLVEDIRQATEMLVWGEKHDGGLFDLFCERQALAGFVAALLAPCMPEPVRVQLWQTLSILVQNARRETSFYYLLSGGHLNTLLAGDPDLRHEETLAYFVAFMKSLSLRLDGETSLLVLDCRPGANWAAGFPLFAQAVRLATHKDHMICTAARAALLTLLRISRPEVRASATEAACLLLVPSLAKALHVSWAAASAAIRLQNIETMRIAIEAEDDLFGFINDLLVLDVTPVTSAIVKDILAAAVLPLFACLAPPLAYQPSGADDLHSKQGMDASEPGDGNDDLENRRCNEFEEDQGYLQLFEGNWFYGTSGTNFHISVAANGQLHFEEKSPAGQVVTGTLRPQGLWHQGELFFEKGGGFGTIRLRFVNEQRAVLSTFKGITEDKWGPDTFAHKLIGTWHYGDSGTNFQITMSDSGTLMYNEQFPSGRKVHGTMQLCDQWFQAALKFTDGGECGTVRLRFVNAHGSVVSSFKGSNEVDWGPDTSCRKGSLESTLDVAGFGPTTTEIARAVYTVVLGLDPAQQGLVGAVIDKVLGQTGFIGLGHLSEEQMSVMSGILVPPPGHSMPEFAAEPTAAAVAVRSVASCIRAFADHRNIALPLSKLLLSPTVPSALAVAVYSPDSDAADMAATAFGLVATDAEAADSEPVGSACSTTSVMIPNPFRAELLALLGDGTLGAVPNEAPLAAWLFRELMQAMPHYTLQDVGLLPQSAQNQVNHPDQAANSIFVPWVQHWFHAGDASYPSTGVTAATGNKDPKVPSLPELLVAALRMRAGLARGSQRVVAAALLDIVSPAHEFSARHSAKQALATALRDASAVLWNAVCHDMGFGFTEVMTAFFEEWEWASSSDSHVDLLATSCSVQCLLHCGTQIQQSQQNSPHHQASSQGRLALRSILLLRSFALELAALERISNGKQPFQRFRNKEACPLDAEVEMQSPAIRSTSSRDFEVPDAWPTISCIGPWGGVYAQGHALVMHPTLTYVVDNCRAGHTLALQPDSARGDRSGTQLRVPAWRTTAWADNNDPRTLHLRVAGPLVGSAIPAAGKSTPPEEVELRFHDADSRNHALKHFQGCRAREVRRLSKQLRAFLDNVLAEFATQPTTVATSMWPARWQCGAAVLS